MTRTQLNEQLRAIYLPKIVELLQAENDVCRIASNKVAIPAVDAEGNEKWITFTVSVPTDESFDGYTEAQFYQEKLQEKTERALERKAAAEMRKKNAEAKRAEKSN